MLPRPQRPSFHDAINYVAGRCKCELEEAGKALHAALGEGALRATANRLIRDHDQPVPLREYVNTGLHPVPSKLWAGYPRSDFLRRAVPPRGNPMYRERTADGRKVGPVYRDPTIATTDIDIWLDRGDDSQKVPDGAASKEKGLIATLYEAIQLKPTAFGLGVDLKPIIERVRGSLGFRVN
jgi:hypothetical protein